MWSGPEQQRHHGLAALAKACEVQAGDLCGCSEVWCSVCVR